MSFLSQPKPAPDKKVARKKQSGTGKSRSTITSQDAAPRSLPGKSIMQMTPEQLAQLPFGHASLNRGKPFIHKESGDPYMFVMYMLTSSENWAVFRPWKDRGDPYAKSNVFRCRSVRKASKEEAEKLEKN